MKLPSHMSSEQQAPLRNKRTHCGGGGSGRTGHTLK